MASNQCTGRVAITIGGNRLTSKEGAKLKYNDKTRETVLGDAGVLGYSEKTDAPEITCTIAHKKGISLAAFEAMNDETVSFDADTGASFVLRNAWCADALELTNGEVSLRFVGMKCEEVGA